MWYPYLCSPLCLQCQTQCMTYLLEYEWMNICIKIPWQNIFKWLHILHLASFWPYLHKTHWVYYPKIYSLPNGLYSLLSLCLYRSQFLSPEFSHILSTHRSLIWAYTLPKPIIPEFTGTSCSRSQHLWKHLCNIALFTGSPIGFFSSGLKEIFLYIFLSNI